MGNNQTMCNGFNKVFYCIHNTPFVIVEPEYNSGDYNNWYVPQFLTKVKVDNLPYIYSKYPQEGDRMSQFSTFYANIDNDTRREVLKVIMETYKGDFPLFPEN